MAHEHCSTQYSCTNEIEVRFPFQIKSNVQSASCVCVNAQKFFLDKHEMVLESFLGEKIFQKLVQTWLAFHKTITMLLSQSIFKLTIAFNICNNPFHSKWKIVWRMCHFGLILMDLHVINTLKIFYFLQYFSQLDFSIFITICKINIFTN